MASVTLRDQQAADIADFQFDQFAGICKVERVADDEAFAVPVGKSDGGEKLRTDGGGYFRLRQPALCLKHDANPLMAFFLHPSQQKHSLKYHESHRFMLRGKVPAAAPRVALSHDPRMFCKTRTTCASCS